MWHLAYETSLHYLPSWSVMSSSIVTHHGRRVHYVSHMSKLMGYKIDITNKSSLVMHEYLQYHHYGNCGRNQSGNLSNTFFQLHFKILFRWHNYWHFTHSYISQVANTCIFNLDISIIIYTLQVSVQILSYYL